MASIVLDQGERIVAVNSASTEGADVMELIKGLDDAFILIAVRLTASAKAAQAQSATKQKLGFMDHFARLTGVRGGGSGDKLVLSAPTSRQSLPTADGEPAPPTPSAASATADAAAEAPLAAVVWSWLWFPRLP